MLKYPFNRLKCNLLNGIVKLGSDIREIKLNLILFVLGANLPYVLLDVLTTCRLVHLQYSFFRHILECENNPSFQCPLKNTRKISEQEKML